ncbi:hypothetical protein J4207_05380 [Candidatus Woesearchaeota archaeon]|nr:hypothetical protein [Candidatus Woesearchaeota archaeon]
MDKSLERKIEKIIRRGHERTNAELVEILRNKMGLAISEKEVASRRGQPDRNYFAYGGLAVLVLGAGIGYLAISDSPAVKTPPSIKNEAVPDGLSPVLQPSEMARITFEEAYANISLRKEHVRQSARAVGIDLNTYPVEYDPDKSLTIETLFTTQHRNPGVQITQDGHVTYFPNVFKTREKFAEEESARDNLMKLVAIFDGYGKYPAPQIFVYPKAYEASHKSAATAPPQAGHNANTLVFQSGFVHEFTHAKDYVNGLFLPGSEKPISKDEVAILMHLGVYEAMCEVHAFTRQIQFQVQQMNGGCRESEKSKYQQFYNQVADTYAKRKAEFELMALAPRLERMFRVLEKNEMHTTIMRK